MKIKLAILLVAGFGIGCLTGFAQTETPAGAEPAVPPAEAQPLPVPLEQTQPAPEQAEPPPAIENAEDLDLQPIEESPVFTGTNSIPAPPDEERGPITVEHELPAAIQFLAKTAGINIIFDPSITFTNTAPGPDGRATPPMVSLRWDNVTARDALQEVLDIHGLMLVYNPKTGIGRITRKPVVAPLVTTVVQLKYSNPSNMVDIVRTTFSDPRSKVNMQPRTSQLVIVTTERDIESITNLIEQLDMPTRQILIEAHLLETAKNPRTIKGIDWSGTLEGQNVTFGNGFTSGTVTTRSPGDSITTTLPSGRTVTTTSGTTTKTDLTTVIGAGGLSMDTARGLHPSTAFLNADGVRAVLSFLNSDSDTEIVATPRQVTADNQTATLSVTRAFPIFEITPGSAQTPPTAEITYTNLGTILKVTPRINDQNKINLKVVPEVSNIDSKDRQIINGAVNEANVYAIRRMETEVVIPSGNTLVMGGLMSDSTTKTFSKVPILGDLPGLGMAFRRDSKSRSKINLIVFVTPTIVEDGDYQPTETDFLKQKPTPIADTEPSAWDSGKPYDWKKNSKNKAK